MIPYLSFSTKSIEEVLHEKNKQFFNPKFPLFFMNEDGNNSIDIALENNQLRSVGLMIDYIVKNQNSYVYSFLFNKNFVDLVNRGIQVTPLLESKIFNREFDYDEWPA